MKRVCTGIFFIYLLAILIILPNHAQAIPASKAIRTLTQSGGETFQARQWGDEHQHGWETLEGFTIVYDSSLKSWTYALRDSEGRLRSSSKRVLLDTPAIHTDTHLRPSKKSLKTKAPLISKESAGAPQKVVQASGEAYVPVLLIQFNDRQATHSLSEFEELFFNNTGSSFSDYYYEVSYENFKVSEGPSGIGGWYTSLRSHDYYGANTSQDSDDRYCGTLVREAVAAADANGYDFSCYDRDGDCYVDVVSVVYQGRGEADGGVPADIWPHSWQLNMAYKYGQSNGGEFVTNDQCREDSSRHVIVNDYILTPELAGDRNLVTIGIMAHEYGHALGLPDLYDTDGSSYGIGRWSLMAYGAYNATERDGDSPAHLDAWSKYALGWVSPTQVDGILANVPIGNAAAHDDVYQLLSGSPESSTGGEYFLLENRQQIGFDSGLPGSGLLVWHIDEDEATYYNSDNTWECYPGGPSCTSDHYHVRLIQADGQWDLEKRYNGGDDGDPYPGSSLMTELNDYTSPGLSFYDGSYSGLSITSISERMNTITATLDGWVDGNPPSVPGDVNYRVDSNTVSLFWTPSTDDWEVAGYSIYKDGSWVEDVSSEAFEDRVSQVGRYCYTVRAYDKSGNVSSPSEQACAQVEEVPYALSLIRPNGGESLQKNNSFLLTWTSENVGNDIAIDLFKGGTGAAYFVQTITEKTENDGGYGFTPPGYLAAGDDYYIKLSAMNGFIDDASDAPFSIMNPPEETDGDGDGYTPEQGDCNDTNDAISPHAEETCGDGVDQNCDGSDLECTTGGDDYDDDLDGYTENEGDCDDLDGLIHPGAVDICEDGIDQDCSGSDRKCDQDIFAMGDGETMDVTVTTGSITLGEYTGYLLQNHTMLYGPVNMEINQVAPGGTVTMAIQFSSPLPDQALVFMIINGRWESVYQSCDFNGDRTKLFVDVVDNGPKDKDSTENRRIESTLCVTRPYQTTGLIEIDDEEEEEEGCFIGSSRAR